MMKSMFRSAFRSLLAGMALLLMSCQNPTANALKALPSEKKSSKPATLTAASKHRLSGVASWYKDRWTASGERYNAKAMTAAHRTLPFGTKVEVICRTGRKCIVRINDRGPYIKGRVIDLSEAAARKLGIIHRGVTPVTLRILK